MKSDKPHHLTIFQATAAEALSFIEAVEGVGFNYVWHVRQPLANKSTHIVYLELMGSLEDAKAKICSIAKTVGPNLDWTLLSHKI